MRDQQERPTRETATMSKTKQIELEAIIAKARAQCNSWVTTQDGSYEMCLNDQGYYKAHAELRILLGKDREDQPLENNVPEDDT